MSPLPPIFKRCCTYLVNPRCLTLRSTGRAGTGRVLAHVGAARRLAGIVRRPHRMSKPYASGELPMVGDAVDLGYGQGPEARVLVVVGGPNAGASANHKLSDWEDLGPGILVDAEGMGLVYEEDPDDEVVLVARDA